MKDITTNEMNFLLCLLKNPKEDYNANSIAKELGISPMGALKIARKLEKERLVLSKELGRAKFYRLNVSSKYVLDYLTFLLKR
ncbi:hypothetical protein J4437_00720 [Candidatus Woesearchaeota archaeon]|nr:hypothetical protein [Candidatus Woesearchaeota archaeon]